MSVRCHGCKPAGIKAYMVDKVNANTECPECYKVRSRLRALAASLTADSKLNALIQYNLKIEKATELEQKAFRTLRWAARFIDSERSGLADDTPPTTREYWLQQNPAYISVLADPDYQAEQRKEETLVLTGFNPNPDKPEYHPKDPSHRRAWVPTWVRFAKRKNQEFRCYYTNWHESDWIQDKINGSVRQVGRLTIDHTLAGSNGGLTTDVNTKMVASVVNNKKSSKIISADDLRAHVFSAYELFTMPDPAVEAMAILRSLGVKKIVLDPSQ